MKKILTALLLTVCSYGFAQTGESQMKKISISRESVTGSSSVPRQVTAVRSGSVAAAVKSDVDSNIPTTGQKSPGKFALIIGNEDYSSFQSNLNQEVNVEFAAHDAETFREYAVKALGIPEENIIFKLNAKSVEMNKMVEKIALIAKSAQGEAEIYVYYAGHGFPDIKTREPYLIPVDCSGELS